MTSKRLNVSAREVARHYHSLIAEELEACARAVEHLDTGRMAARWLRKRAVALVSLPLPHGHELRRHG